MKTAVNQTTEEGKPPVQKARLRQYGPEVQESLVQVWEQANRICSKRLIPFLSTFVEALERHGQLHLEEACREQLLRMSAATADRLLHQARGRGPHGLSTTRAGTLLKQRIPIRTFQQWEEHQPGFLEVDAVAHSGSDLEGSVLPKYPR